MAYEYFHHAVDPEVQELFDLPDEKIKIEAGHAALFLYDQDRECDFIKYEHDSHNYRLFRARLNGTSIGCFDEIAQHMYEHAYPVIVSDCAPATIKETCIRFNSELLWRELNDGTITPDTFTHYPTID